MASRKLIVEIVGDSRSLDRTFRKSEQSASRFFGTFSKGAVGMTAAFAGVAVGTRFMRQAITAASDLAEQQSKTTVVFGQSAEEVKDWAKTTSRSFGIAERQALATASSFGALFAPLGLVGEQAADQSRLLTQLGADLASFYNTDVQDALDAIRSGIVGESEPLRRYGVLLTETRVAQQAMADTGKKNAAQLTAQEKALARIKIIFQDTTKAQGDFSRTSDGLANQTRILKAEIDDLATTIGSVLIPVLTEVTKGLNALISDTGRLASSIRGGLINALDSVPILGAAAGLVRSLRGKGEEAGKGFAEGFAQAVAESPRFEAAIARIPRPAAAAAPGFTPTAAMRNQWFDARIARELFRLQDLSLQKQVAQLKVVAAELRARIAITDDVTRRLNLEDTLIGVLRDQKSVQKEIADNAKAAAEAAKERRREAARQRAEAAARAARREETRQFGILGLGAGGAELVPNAASLRKTFNRLKSVVKTMEPAMRRMFEKIRDVLFSGVKISPAVLQWIDDWFDAVDDKFKDRGGELQSRRWKKLSIDAIAAALGLTEQQKRALSFYLAGGGTTPSRGSGQFAFAGGGGTVINGPVHFHGVQNLRQLEEEMARRTKARPHQRRGAR